MKGHLWADKELSSSSWSQNLYCRMVWVKYDFVNDDSVSKQGRDSEQKTNLENKIEIVNTCIMCTGWL